MAEDNENRSTDDLSDEPSPYRLEEMRKQGKVAQSRELASLIALFGAGISLYLLSPQIKDSLLELMRQSFQADWVSKVDFTKPGVLREVFMGLLMYLAKNCLPISIIGFVCGALGSFAQIGSVVSSDPLTPDLQRLDPIQGMKKLFTLRQLIELFRILLKGSTIIAIAWWILSAGFEKDISQIFGSPEMMLDAIRLNGRNLFLTLVGVLLVFSGFDYWLQRNEFMKQARLTKQEAKQEHKEHEGDPQIRARVRAIQRDVARKRMMQAVKKADVVVTNPTHIAIAIQYDKEKMNAPRVIAKGADLIAQQIKKIAEANGIPMVENVPLARTLFKSVKLGQIVPRALYQAVAEVLAYVYRLRMKKPDVDSNEVNR